MSPLLVPGTENVCVSYEPEDESYAFRPRRAVHPRDIGNGVGRQETEKERYVKTRMKKRAATHIVPPEILDDAPRTLRRPSKHSHPATLLFCSFFFSPSFSLFPRDVFCSWISAVCLPSTPSGATRKRLYHGRENLSSKLRAERRAPAGEASEKLSCLWRIDKRWMRRRKKYAPCTRALIRVSAVNLKICAVLNARYVSPRVNIGRLFVMRLHPQNRPRERGIAHAYYIPTFCFRAEGKKR